LAGIGSKDKKERSTAERKAVNTVCQVNTIVTPL
jgi:hypothetical protein